MPSRKWLPILALPLLLVGCKRDRALEERAQQIQQLSDQENRAYTAEAIAHIRRKFWTMRNNAWYGKLPDGSIIRIDAPHASAAPLPSRSFYSGWHLQLTITSEDWRTFPDSPHDHPFRAVYAITRHSATSWDIRVTNDGITFPLERDDLAQIPGN